MLRAPNGAHVSSFGGDQAGVASRWRVPLEWEAMIRSPLPLLAACLIAGSAATLHAQQTPPPVDPKAVLTTLKDLRAKQPGFLSKEKSEMLAAINAAIAEPEKTYQKAVEAVELQGVPTPPPTPHPTAGHVPAPKVDTHVLDTRKQVGEQVRDHDFVVGLRLQLVYLSLTWQHGMGNKTKDLLPALLDYVGQVNQNLDSLQTLDMFKKPLGDSIFVSYFQVGPYINALPDWSNRLFDTASIYQATILPEMRRTKDPRLLAYWNDTIQTETTRATATGNNLVTAKFNHIRRPSLLWSRAEDEMVLGATNQAVIEMLGLIKANPDHPDFDKWATELEGVVSAQQATLPPGDATPAENAVATPTPVGR